MLSEFFRRYRDVLLVLLVASIPFIVYVSSAKDVRDHNVFDRVVVFVSAPLQWLVTSTVTGAIGAWTRYVYLVDVERRYEDSVVERAKLSRALHEHEEVRLENERLRALIGLKERAGGAQMAHARVVAVMPNPLFRSIRLDKGSADGIRVGAAVMAYEGVVGRVAAVTGGWSDVMLLVDTNSSTDVLVQRTRARARVRGTGTDERLGVQVQYLPRTADVAPGDLLITSGAGEVFPKGLRVGTVISTSRRAFGLYQDAEVEPAVDFTRLEEVMVAIGRWPPEVDLERGPSSGTPMAPDLMDSAVEEPQTNHVQLGEPPR